MTVLRPCRDPTYAAPRVWPPCLLLAADPWPSLPQADLSQAHFCELSMPQLPGRSLALRDAHPEQQRTTQGGSATNSPLLDATPVHRTCEESLQLLPSPLRAPVRPKAGSPSLGKILRAGSRFRAGRVRLPCNASDPLAAPACIGRARPSTLRAGTPGTALDRGISKQP